MNFSQSSLTPTARPRLPLRPCALTIAVGLLTLCPIAHPATAKSTAPTQPTQTITNGRSATIALKSTNTEPQTIVSPKSDFRLLGYGLFLLQIGLIPLKLAKGNRVQTID